MVAKDSKDAEDDEIKLADMDGTQMADIGDKITFLASQMPRTIAPYYRDYESRPPAGSALDYQKQVYYSF